MPKNGFTLIEVLIALSLFMIGILFLLQGVRTVLDFSSKMNERTDTIARLENFLFEIESGSRDDLFYQGGKETSGGFRYEVESKEGAPHYEELRISSSTVNPKDSVDLTIYLRGHEA